MAQTSSKANAYVQNAAGIWTPVGYGSTNAAMPTALTSPGALANGSYFAGIQPYGTQRVTTEPVPVFYDSFDSGTALDTTNRWTTGGTVVPTVQGGYLAVNSGLAANASSRLTSQMTFAPPGYGYAVFSAAVGIETTAVANIYRFWGWGTDANGAVYQGASAAPSSTLTDAIGFETDTTGNVYGVIYNAQSVAYRTPALTRPNDGSVRRYIIFRRHDAVYWYLDTMEYPVAQRQYATTAQQNMPLKFVAYNNSTALTAQPSFNIVTVTSAETAARTMQISDGTYPNRKAKVNATGDQVVSLSSPAAIANGQYAQTTPWGTLRVTQEPTTMFTESFDNAVALDPLKWSVAGSSATLTPASGFVQVPATANGTTASFVQRLTSIPTFVVPGSGFLMMQASVLVDAIPVANTYRFWGFASDATTPAYQAAGAATSTAVLDAVGWELDNTGVLSAVVYSNGTNSYRVTVPQSLWATSSYHRFYLVRRESQVWWFIDSLETPVASRTITGQGTWVDALPIKFGSYNNSTAPAAAATFAITSTSVGDTTHQNHTISDPTYQFRRVQVTPSNHMKTQPYSASVGNSSPAMTTAAATVLAANTSRIGATVFNDAASASPVYLALGITATTAAFTMLVAVGGYYEVPYGFTGAITGICASGTATLRVNELT
jgi:hypothetical protein